MEGGLAFLNIVEVLDVGLVDGEDVCEAFGVLFGRGWPDEKPAVVGFLQFLGTMKHK